MRGGLLRGDDGGQEEAEGPLDLCAAGGVEREGDSRVVVEGEDVAEEDEDVGGVEAARWQEGVGGVGVEASHGAQDRGPGHGAKVRGDVGECGEGGRRPAYERGRRRGGEHANSVGRVKVVAHGQELGGLGRRGRRRGRVPAVERLTRAQKRSPPVVSVSLSEVS